MKYITPSYREQKNISMDNFFDDYIWGIEPVMVNWMEEYPEYWLNIISYDINDHISKGVITHILIIDKKEYELFKFSPTYDKSEFKRKFIHDNFHKLLVCNE